MKKCFLILVFICMMIGSVWISISSVIARNGTAYVEYEIIYPDSIMQYSDTVNFVYHNADICRFERHNLKPIRVTSCKGSNYIEVYDHKVVQNTCPIRLKNSKIISYDK